MEAIGTIYKNVRFRSRLEARWAVFFDNYGLKWEYEPETFKLKNGILYCPDFYLPDLKCYAEVKQKRDLCNEYISTDYDLNTGVILSQVERTKLFLFEKNICLLIGTPRDEPFVFFNLLHKNISIYPIFNRYNFWHWHHCEYLNDFGDHRGVTDIETAAKIAREYDFFKF